MRDRGLSEAIQAVGGVSELARRVGISQPSVSNWDKVPAERVLMVEAATGVDRKVLRPDLYQEREAPARAIDEIDVARAQEYTLLSALLVRAPNAALLKKLSALRGDATPLGVAHVALAGPRRRPRSSGSSANTSICSSGSGAANCCPTPRTISPASCMSGRSRACARILVPSVSSASTAITNRRTTPRPCARSWRVSWAAVCRRRKAATGASSKSIFRPGSDVSSPIWSARTRPGSTATSELLGRVFMEIEKEAFALPS